jgi:hypothetical protein
MQDSTNVNEFENPGSNGNSSQTFRNFASGLDLILKYINEGPAYVCKVHGGEKNWKEILYNWLTELFRQTRILHEILSTELNICLAMFSFCTTKERFRYYEPNTISVT